MSGIVISYPSQLRDWLGVSKLLAVKKCLLDEGNSNIKISLEQKIVRRLTYFSEGGGKYRYIALGD